MAIQRIDPGVRFSQAVVPATSCISRATRATNAEAGVYEQTARSSPRSTPTSRRPGRDKSGCLERNIWLPDITRSAR